MTIQLFRDGLTLHQNYRLIVPHDGVVYFFALFDSDICGELRNKLLGIENVISQHCEERHNQRCFGGFLRLQGVLHRIHTLRELLQLVNEIHNTHTPAFVCVSDSDTFIFYPHAGGMSLVNFRIVGATQQVIHGATQIIGNFYKNFTARNCSCSFPFCEDARTNPDFFCNWIRFSSS